MQPLQDDFRDPAAKDNSITNAATARSNLDAAITMRSAETELQNTIELRATASEIVAPKPDGSRRQSQKKTILKHFLKGFLEGKSLAPKKKTMEKICWQITLAAFMQPLQYDLRSPAAKDNSITHTAKAGSNLDAATTSEKKTILKHFLKGFLEGKSLAPKWRKSANKSISQPSCSHPKRDLQRLSCKAQ